MSSCQCSKGSRIIWRRYLRILAQFGIFAYKHSNHMFEKEIYIRRRATLIERMGAYAPEGKRGIAIFIGNVDAPAQYRDNAYAFRQDSTWLYYFGIDLQGYAAIIDLDSAAQTIYADDVDIDDVIWSGPQPSVRSIAEGVGVTDSAPAAAFGEAVRAAVAKGREVHFIPPSRYYNTLRLRDLSLDPSKSSEALVKAIISMRLVKEDVEIEQMDNACDIGFRMHSLGRSRIKIGASEQDIAGAMDGYAIQKGWGVSFPTILTQHGETLHLHGHTGIVVPGRLMLIDAGAENNMHYPSDFTRTYPTGGKFTGKQRDIYEIVCRANETAFSLTKPGVAYRDVHLAVEKILLGGLRDLGLVRGDLDDMVSCGICGMFMPHGLGHNIGLDVHDMEDLGENLVGYDPDQKRAPRMGLGSLRMARRLVPGNVISDEPGIYFIPALIEKWKKEGTGRDFVNYAALEDYYDFGGIRLEDDVLVTADGARRLGHERLPILPDDVEAAMATD